MEKAPVFEDLPEKKDEDFEKNQQIEESKPEETNPVKADDQQPVEEKAPLSKVMIEPEVPMETVPATEEKTTELEEKTEPKCETEGSGCVLVSVDSTEPKIESEVSEEVVTSEQKEEKTSETEPLDEPEKLRKLFVGALPHNVEHDMLKNFYSQFGDIEDIFIARDKFTGTSRGYAFVTFSKKASIDAVIASRPHELAGKPLCEKRATPKGSGTTDTVGLYLTGITEAVSERALSAYFSKYGPIDSVKIHTDEATKMPRGFAFVNFFNSDSTDQCVLDSSLHHICGVEIKTQKAVPKHIYQQNQRDRQMRALRSRGDPQQGSQGGWGMGMPPPPHFFVPPPFVSQFPPPPFPRDNQNLAYRASAGADRSPSANNNMTPEMRSWLAGMAASAAMQQALQRGPPPSGQGRGGYGGFF